jgi:hypothetical protein
MHPIVLPWRPASALILACALAACGGGDGGFASPAASGSTTGAQKTGTPAQATPSDSTDVRYAP